MFEVPKWNTDKEELKSPTKQSPNDDLPNETPRDINIQHGVLQSKMNSTRQRHQSKGQRKRKHNTLGNLKKSNRDRDKSHLAFSEGFDNEDKKDNKNVCFLPEGTLNEQERNERKTAKRMRTNKIRISPTKSTKKIKMDPNDKRTENLSSKEEITGCEIERNPMREEPETVDEKRNEMAMDNDSHSNKSKTDEMNPSNKFKTKLKNKLDGAQFRWINQQLYTSESENAFMLFQKNQILFDVYHRGFQAQVRSWPENPLDVIIQQVKNSSSDIIVADLGCGEAKLAQNVKQKVYSFDLVAKNKFVTACDMAKLPLNSCSVDMAVFCLSLMGTNLSDFLKEANRILKPRGTLKIAEVTSRLHGLHEFIEAISKFGFKLISKNTSNRMFVLMDFQKVHVSEKMDKINIRLKPCIYKKR